MVFSPPPGVDEGSCQGQSVPALALADSPALGFDACVWLDSGCVPQHSDAPHRDTAALRTHIVREAGPEVEQFFSAPSVPMRLRMPDVQVPKVSKWFELGRPRRLLRISSDHSSFVSPRSSLVCQKFVKLATTVSDFDEVLSRN